MFSSLKRLFGGKPAFEIVQSATGTATGGKPAVLLSAALHSASGQEAMVSQLLEQFKIQRMLSPAETDLLLITIVGPCDAPSFVARWRALVEADQVAGVFMQRMTKADLGCTDSRSFHSLLAAP
eukprot:TRINITY_DN9755_c0_g5_i1.p1 TRINITY_DN9755_c0_g5~~TRINITY_DN9755_c0_g5_i1.p1  ORF type:complete len:124 (+),score=12.37 TRINITY_DN9755_c0_g5_i1:148-519(+)